MKHRLALASGAALAYAWHAFIENPAAGGMDSSVRVGNAIFAALLRRVADHPINRIGELLPWNLFPVNRAREEAA